MVIKKALSLGLLNAHDKQEMLHELVRQGINTNLMPVQSFTDLSAEQIIGEAHKGTFPVLSGRTVLFFSTLIWFGCC